MFPLFETIKIENGIPLHLEYHQRRLDASILTYFDQGRAFPELSELLSLKLNSSTFNLEEKNPIKCKFLYNRETFQIEFIPYTPKVISGIRLICLEDVSYELKFSERQQLDDLLRIYEADEVLILKKGFITDTSFSNVCFHDGNQWVTPSMPLLKGTARERLLEHGVIVERPIKASDLKNYQKLMLINAMLDFDEARSMDIGMLLT